MRSIARAPLEVDEFGLHSTTAAPAASEARTHQRGNALLAGTTAAPAADEARTRQRFNALLADLPVRGHAGGPSPAVFYGLLRGLCGPRVSMNSCGSVSMFVRVTAEAAFATGAGSTPAFFTPVSTA